MLSRRLLYTYMCIYKIVSVSIMVIGCFGVKCHYGLWDSCAQKYLLWTWML